jgi:hypothetical protein
MCYEENCAICLESVGMMALRLPCRHRFHHECIEEWLSRHASCPLCRRKFHTLEKDDDLLRSMVTLYSLVSAVLALMVVAMFRIEGGIALLMWTVANVVSWLILCH